MRMNQILNVSLGLLVLSACHKSGNRPKAPAPTISAELYTNGTILTMEGAEPSYVEALVVVGAKIVFVGDRKDAESEFPSAREIDLKGLTLLPGFIDPHSHIGMVIDTMGQADLSSPPVGGVTNFESLVERLVAFKKERNIPDGKWIFGWGYDENQLEEKQHITKHELDAALPTNPVYVAHTSGHMGVANSLALAAANVTADTKNPEGGIIARFPGTSEPTGLVQEVAMYDFARIVIAKMVPKRSQLFDQAQDHYAANGITTAQEGNTDPGTVAVLKDMAAAHRLKIDVVSLPGSDELDPKKRDLTLIYGRYENGLKFQGNKIVADGSPQGKTAFFTEPYLTPVPGCEKDCRGFANLSQAELNEQFTTAYKIGRQLFIHSNGDASIDMIIAAHEAACDATGQARDADRRTVVVHSQFIRKDQLATYKKYKLMPSFFTNHAFFWGDVHVTNLGQERAFAFSPLQSADSLGLIYTNHTDTTVTPINQLFSIWTAVNRVSRSGVVIGAEERVSPYLALKAITIHAAQQLFDEDLKGSLAPGKLADLVILDANPLTVPSMEIKNIEVVQTIKEGETIYTKAAE